MMVRSVDGSEFSPTAPPPMYGQVVPPPAYNQPPPPLPPPTGIPVMQPVRPMQVHNNSARGRWSTGLCDCFTNIPNCCVTCCCPCITFGQIAEIIDKGSTSCGASGALYALIMYLTGCGCIYSCSYRTRMRQQYMLEEGPCPDCMVHFCCECCALCQEYRELQNRGLDMSFGWQGNVERERQAATMSPFVQGMNR